MNSSHFSLSTLRCGLWSLTGPAALGLGAALIWQVRSPDGQPHPIVTGGASITNAYTLTDQTGRAVTAETFARQWQLVFFGFFQGADFSRVNLILNITELTNAPAPERGWFDNLLGALP